MECMLLLCPSSNLSHCQPCRKPLSSEHKKNWNDYIELIVSNWKDKSQSHAYFTSLRERPLCCTARDGQSCRLYLTNEPRKDPHKFYDLTCVKDDFFGRLHCDDPTNNRCCRRNHCNIPTIEELSILRQKPSPDYLPVLLVLAVLIISAVALLIFFKFCRKRNRKTRSRKPNSSSKLNYPGDDCLPGSDTGLLAQGCYSNTAGLISPSSALVVSSSLSASSSTRTGSLHHVIGVGGGYVASAYGGISIGSGYLGSSIGMSTTTVATPGYCILSTASGGTGVNTGSTMNCCSLSPNTTSTGTLTSAGMSNPTSIVPSNSTNNASPSPSLRDLLETGSGSGSGAALLVQRTVAREVQLEERIGEGRYGDVWRGVWQCDQVAAKIFSTRDERSWFRETEIYQTVMLRHANILGFIAADNKDNGVAIELWLITEYHPLGSLFDFLHDHCWLPAALLRAVASIANGLAHLHMEITGIQGKPAIAHRDLKSRNILVKLDGECCIGDLGFALKLDATSLSSTDFTSHSDRVGTKRYMAPEVLDNTLRHTAPQAFKLADMYSLGLIFWEMTRRCYVYGLCGPEDYQLPYQDHVPHDPSVEEMKSIVCEQGVRPLLPTIWSRHGVLDALQSIMTECWYASPQARLSAMRVKKSLATIRKHIIMNSNMSVSPPATLLPPSTCGHTLPPGIMCYPSVVVSSANANSVNATISNNKPQGKTLSSANRLSLSNPDTHFLASCKTVDDLPPNHGHCHRQLRQVVDSTGQLDTTGVRVDSKLSCSSSGSGSSGSIASSFDDNGGGGGGDHYCWNDPNAPAATGGTGTLKVVN